MNIETTPSHDEVEVTLARLFTSGPAIKPLDALWAAIDSAINEDAGKIDRMVDGVWATTAVGVRTKLLWDSRSLLIQCEIGAVIPEHEHFAEERIMVISGDMIIGGHSYGSGDTVWMAKGTAHGVTTTKTGCVILISYVN